MHLFIIGYRGSGKSTLGRILAEALDWPLVDTDQVIRERADKSIAEIFSEGGEAAFRDVEQAVVRDVANGPQSVISLGGGAILREANQRTIRSAGKCIWLTGSPEVHYSRIMADAASPSSRPNLTDRSGCDEVAEVMQVREPIYRDLAQLEVNTDSRSPDDLLRAILPYVKSWTAEE